MNRDITEGLFTSVMSEVAEKRRASNLVLIIVTLGGVANEAYRTTRYLQSIYDNLVVFVPAVCKSAGTLMATGANQIVMGPFGEIGPLDVQLLQRDEITGSRSGLTTRSALDDLKRHSFEMFQHFMLSIVNSSKGAVSFKTAADISTKVSSEVMSVIYNQINPEALGQDFRDLEVATKYCERLNRRFANLRTGAIKRLVHDYPSHDFVIDGEEAREIFVRLSLPPPSLLNLMVRRAQDTLALRSTKAPLVEMLTLDGEPVAKNVAAGSSETGSPNDPDHSDTTGGDGDRAQPEA
ncbi:SDH family Clp fold serine proteinase [Methylobacterium brachiatum]|uniref:SDH family Clp fold serine proteinase n=1 Tax=Methylobacterium brachiatum TaxID=269660 RepID=UPI0013CF3EBB|nr:hypothetical protein [Methylobacterium brachiatum]